MSYCILYSESNSCTLLLRSHPVKHFIYRGRYFDETTLPDRPDFTSLIPPKRPTTHQITLGSIPSKRNDARDSPLRVSPSRELQSRPKERDVHAEDIQQRDRDLKASRTQSPATTSHRDTRKQGVSDASNVGVHPDKKGKDDLDSAKAARSNLGLLNGRSDGTNLNNDQLSHTTIEKDLHIEDDGTSSTLGASSLARNALERKQARQPSQSPPPVIQSREDERRNSQRMGANSLGEQASSPNSTVGHHSSNTPGVTAVSPDTSPENGVLDDEMEGVEGAQPGPGTEKSVSPRKVDSSAQHGASSNAPDRQKNVQPPPHHRGHVVDMRLPSNC